MKRPQSHNPDPQNGSLPFETAPADSQAVTPTASSPRWAPIVFCVFLALHAFLVSRNWEQGFLVGHEFRQAQTALSILFIQRDDDYSLAYPTPLFGPPWSIPMEFPLYQWSVAWLGDKMDWTLPQAARSVSVFCFYLALPAILLILKALKFEASVRWGSLSLVLTTPVYLFYTRTVLIESMALMFTLWFVLCFIRMCQTQSYVWMLVAGLIGSAAALVKVTSMMAWCMGLAIGGVWWSWQQWRNHGFIAWRKSVFLGIGCAALPGIITLWWVGTADAIKLKSAGAAPMVSSEMTDFNFGTWADRTASEAWSDIGTHISVGVVPTWILGIVLLVAVFALIRHRQGQHLAALAWFLAVILIFPLLYRIHDYYFYAIAVLPAVAIAGAFRFATRSFKMSWIPSVLVVVVALFQLSSFRANYYDYQRIESNGGLPWNLLIRDTTDPDEVLIIIGHDWSAASAYYTQRRTFMIQASDFNDRQQTLDNLEILGDYRVGCLIVTGPRRSEKKMIAAITARFGLDSNPSASSEKDDLYMTVTKRSRLLSKLALDPNYSGIKAAGNETIPLPQQLDKIVADSQIQPVTPNLAETVFVNVLPSPYQYRAQFGFSKEYIAESYATGCHPDSDIWVKTPAGATHVDLSFGIREESYADPANATSGAEFIVTGVSSDGTETQLFSNIIDPKENEDHRGPNDHSVQLPTPRPVSLIFSSRPGPDNSYAFDWAYWRLISVR